MKRLLLILAVLLLVPVGLRAQEFDQIQALEPGSVELIKFTWADLGDDETGTGVYAPAFADRSVQISGTLGAGTVVIQGSLDCTPVRATDSSGDTYYQCTGGTWDTITDTTGTALSFSSLGTTDLKGVLQMTIGIRPVTASGSSNAVDVVLAGRRDR